jgi:hypothetical protein
MVFALTVTAIAAGMAGSGIDRLARATAVESARLRTLAALLDARRRAYADEATVQVDIPLGGTTLTIRNPDAQAVAIALPAGTLVEHSAASGKVRFYGTSLADNATITLADSSGSGRATIVVNQRGLIR